MCSRIKLTESYRQQVVAFKGTVQMQADEAKNEAVYNLKEEVKAIYQHGPLYSHQEKLGQCLVCKHNESWQTTDKQSKLGSFIAYIILFLWLGACIVIPIAWDKPGLIPVFLIGSFVLLFVGIYVYSAVAERFPSRKQLAKKAELDAIPEENRPVFILSAEQVCQKITENYSR